MGRHLCLSVKLVHSFSLSNHSYNIDFLVAVKIIGANWRLQSFNYISPWHRTRQSSALMCICRMLFDSGGSKNKMALGESSRKLRQHDKIRVYVVEDHNEVRNMAFCRISALL